MTNEYNNPDDTSAATLAAFVALGNEIVGLRWNTTGCWHPCSFRSNTTSTPTATG